MSELVEQTRRAGIGLVHFDLFSCYSGEYKWARVWMARTVLECKGRVGRNCPLRHFISETEQQRRTRYGLVSVRDKTETENDYQF